VSESERPNWRQALFNRRMLICILTGFSSGLPLYLLFSLLPAWLRTEGLSLTLIGAFALIQFPYTWKFLWAPLLDRYGILPWLGRRRSWMLVSQLCLIAAIAWLGRLSPTEHLAMVVVVTTVLAFLSATQDIALDAFRREILPDIELGLGNAIHVNAYRISGLVPGSLSLILADRMPWDQVFLITALFMLPGLVMTLTVKEPAAAALAPRSLRDAVIEPFREFFGRHGVSSALLVLAFLFLYKVGDSLAGAIATPFYLDMGYTMTEIGVIAQNASLWPMVIGGILGGLWMLRLGINRALWVFGFAQVISTAGFIWLAWLGPAEADAFRRVALGVVITGESLGAGLGTAAFVAFIARTTHPAYTATQFALFTSLMAVPRTFVNASAGWLVERIGWVDFFSICVLIAIPGMLLLLKVAPWHGEQAANDAMPVRSGGK
jgi:PAT family beta-lactamase induction signal transducer AmpG